MMVKHELETTLHNLRIEKQKTEKTIELLHSFLNDQFQKREQLAKEIYVAKDLLNVLNSEINTPSK